MDTSAVRDEIIPRLDALLAKMGEGGEFVWETARRQAIIDGWLWAVLGGVVTLAFLSLFGTALVHWRAADAGSDDANGYGVLTGMFLALFLMAGVPTISYAVPRLLNPDMYALRIAMDMVSRLIP